MRALHVRLSLLMLLLAGPATAADAPVQDLTPPGPCQEYAQWFRSKGADVSVVVYANAYHGFDSLRAPAHARNVVTGRGCDMKVDVDRFAVTIRATGEDITRTATTYARGCLAKGATVGGDSEARRKSPEDVKAFLKRINQ